VEVLAQLGSNALLRRCSFAVDTSDEVVAVREGTKAHDDVDGDGGKVGHEHQLRAQLSPGSPLTSMQTLLAMRSTVHGDRHVFWSFGLRSFWDTGFVVI